MQLVDLHPSLLLAISDVSDGNIDERFSPKKELKQNRENLFKTLKIDPHYVIEGEQVHETRILTINAENSIMWKGVKVTGVDGFITNQKTIALMIRVADCVPMIMFDPDNKVVATIHAGWRGAQANIHLKALAEMINRFKTNPKHLLVYLGPSACGSCFISEKAPEQQADEFWQEHIKSAESNYHVDIVGYIKDTLYKNGISKKNLKTSNVCTIESENYFSAQRSKNTHTPEGRFAVIAKIR